MVGADSHVEGWGSVEVLVLLSFSQLKKIIFQVTLLISNIKNQELLVCNNLSYLIHPYFPMVLSSKDAHLFLHITRLGKPKYLLIVQHTLTFTNKYVKHRKE